MSTAPSESTLERVETTPPRIKPTAHWWHAKCQGKEPGPKIAYCGQKLNARGAKWWNGEIDAEDCVVCVDLIESGRCMVCEP